MWSATQLYGSQFRQVRLPKGTKYTYVDFSDIFLQNIGFLMSLVICYLIWSYINLKNMSFRWLQYVISHFTSTFIGYHIALKFLKFVSFATVFRMEICFTHVPVISWPEKPLVLRPFLCKGDTLRHTSLT